MPTPTEELRAIEQRPHQEDCLRNLEAARAKGATKALVIAASGFGKTITAICDAKKFIEQHGGRVLCLCHRNDILNQLNDEFKAVLGHDYSYGMYNGNEKSDTQDGRKVDFLFASFQTMASDVVRSRFTADEFSYIIVDEAHHAPARTFYQTLKYFRPSFLLGMTATPDRQDKADLNAIFGQTVYEKRFAVAIAEGLLAVPKVRLLLDEVAKIGQIYWQEAGRKISASELNKRMFAKIRDDAIVRLINEEIALAGIANPRTVIFCCSIKHAENIAQRIEGAVLFHSVESGKHGLPKAQARKNLQDFRDGTVKTIVVIDKLNEGIDVPAINVIVNLRQLGSRIPSEQQLGRGLRRVPGKDFVLVLDFVANIQRLNMYWRMDQDLRNIKTVHPDDLKIPGSSSETNYSVTGLDISTNHPQFQREDFDLMAGIREIIARTEPYTREELILQLQCKAQELGRTPNQHDINDDPNMAAAATFAHEFDSLNTALKVAGLELNRKNYTREELLGLYMALTKKLGRTPTVDDLDADSSMPCYETYRNTFGPIALLQEAAGLEPLTHFWSEKELVDQIHAAVKRYGKVPTAKQVDKDPLMAGTPAFIRLFDSWNGAVRAAGYIVRRGNYTKEDVAGQIKNLSKLLGGKTPNMDDIKAHPLIIVSYRTITKVCGSYFAACKELGLKPNSYARKNWE